MRVSRAQAQQNRERIVTEASRLFRERGFDGVGVDAIMKAAGLTHGGFYGHFDSKDELIAEAVQSGLLESMGKERPLETLKTLTSRYLSPGHRSSVETGCLLAALGGDMTRHRPVLEEIVTSYVRTEIERIARLPGIDRAKARQQAIGTYAGLVGGMILARVVSDPALSDEILQATQTALNEQGQTKTAAPDEAAATSI